MSKQTRSSASAGVSPAPAVSSAPPVGDASSAYSDPMALQTAPGGGNDAAKEAIGRAGDAGACAGVGLVSSEGQNRMIDQSLEDIYRQQAVGLSLFGSIAKGEDASFSEALAVSVAEEIVSTAITDVADLAVAAVAAYTGVGTLIGGAFLAGMVAARGKIAGGIASEVTGVVDDPSADWLKGFVAAQSDALFEGQRATAKAWIKATDGQDSDRLCGLNDALESVLAAAPGVQYRRSVAGWARYCGRQASEGVDRWDDQQNEGFAREYELRVDLSMDASDPRKVVVAGGSIPGLSPDLLRHPHMAGVKVANAGFLTRVVFAGGEIMVGAGGRVLDVRADSIEAREQLRRLGSVDEKSAAPASWKATTGALGDEMTELHVQNGAQKLVSLHVAPKALAELGLPAPAAK